jgi:hypothetical protein
MCQFYKKILVAIILMAWGTAAFAQESISDLKKEIEGIKEGQQAIQKELQEIKSLLPPYRIPRIPTSSIKT